jgi:hypothetical protein
MIIDFHTHIMPPRIKEKRLEYIEKDRNFAAIYSGDDVKIATAEELIASMDRDGVEISVILNYGWSTQALCVEVNNYIMEAMSNYPKRLIGFCSVVPSDGEPALRELERCIRNGIRGIGELRPDVHFKNESQIKIVKPLMDMIIENDIIMLVHTSDPIGHQYPGKGKATPEILYSLITSFPALKLVCAHWGGGLPFYTLMPEVKTTLQNVYFDTAISPFLYTSKVYEQVIQLVGANRILFGTDYPMLRPRRFFKEIGSLNLLPEIKEKILGVNAQRLLGIK